MKSHFFAILARMKFIYRWGLMHNTIEENIQEHTLQVAMIAHNLAILRNMYYDGHVNPDRVAVLAMYHDVSEVYTGDLPTPIKYFSTDMRQHYGIIEKQAQEKLLHTLPAELQSIYAAYLVQPERDDLWELVKAADTISAFLKCAEEKKSGNPEFNEAYISTLEKLNANPLPEVKRFLDTFGTSFSLSVDAMNKEDLL